MKITNVSYWKEELGLTRPYAVTYVMHDTVDNIFIRIDCENDLVGLGAGSPSVYVTGEKLDTDFRQREEELRELLVGRDIQEYRQLIWLLRNKYLKQPALIAALDMALHDAFCHYIQTPLLTYLGKKIQPLATSVTIGIKDLDEVIEEGLEYKGRGFKIIKLKIGLSPDEDIERFIKLREAVGYDMKIRVDANQGFGPSELLNFLDAAKPYQVEFFEQPFKPGNKTWMLDLDPGVRNICAADEDLHDMNDAMYLSEGRAYGIFNIKIMKCGGISEALRIGEVAARRDIALMWGCMDESIISITASLNASMACPTTRFLDLDGSLDLARDLVTGGFEIREGVMYPRMEAHGLGVSLIK